MIGYKRFPRRKHRKKKNYVTLILVVIFFDIAPKAQETKAKPY